MDVNSVEGWWRSSETHDGGGKKKRVRVSQTEERKGADKVGGILG